MPSGLAVMYSSGQIPTATGILAIVAVNVTRAVQLSVKYRRALDREPEHARFRRTLADRRRSRMTP
jgi:hypothetical protein